jgi:hypothetical protein
MSVWLPIGIIYALAVVGFVLLVAASKERPREARLWKDVREAVNRRG